MTRLIDVDELYVDARLGENEEPYISLHQINNAPTIEAVPKNMVFHVDTYDDMTEEYTKEGLTLEELLDRFTDEGYPNTLNALDALEDEDEAD